MEQTKCSETSAYKILMPGNHPKESIQHSEHGESLKSNYITIIIIIIIIIIIVVKLTGLSLAPNCPDHPGSRFARSALPRDHSIWQYSYKLNSEQNNFHITIYLITQYLNVVVSLTASNFACSGFDSLPGFRLLWLRIFVIFRSSPDKLYYIFSTITQSLPSTSAFTIQNQLHFRDYSGKDNKGSFNKLRWRQLYNSAVTGRTMKHIGFPPVAWIITENLASKAALHGIAISLGFHSEPATSFYHLNYIA